MSGVDDAAFRRKAVSGVGWVAADKWSNRLMGLVVLTVLGRLLTPTEFGLVALATAFMALANVFVDQGFGRAIVQRKDLTSADTSTAFWISLASSGLLALLTVLFAPLISSLFGEVDELTPII